MPGYNVVQLLGTKRLLLIVITINSLSIVSPFLVQLLYVLCAFIAAIYMVNKDEYIIILEMWANAQRDGHPAEYRWRRLFNAAKFG